MTSLNVKAKRTRLNQTIIDDDLKKLHLEESDQNSNASTDNVLMSTPHSSRNTPAQTEQNNDDFVGSGNVAITQILTPQSSSNTPVQMSTPHSSHNTPIQIKQSNVDSTSNNDTSTPQSSRNTPVQIEQSNNDSSSNNGRSILKSVSQSSRNTPNSQHSQKSIRSLHTPPVLSNISVSSSEQFAAHFSSIPTKLFTFFPKPTDFQNFSLTTLFFIGVVASVISFFLTSRLCFPEVNDDWGKATYSFYWLLYFFSTFLLSLLFILLIDVFFVNTFNQHQYSSFILGDAAVSLILILVSSVTKLK